MDAAFEGKAEAVIPAVWIVPSTVSILLALTVGVPIATLSSPAFIKNSFWSVSPSMVKSISRPALLITKLLTPSPCSSPSSVI